MEKFLENLQEAEKTIRIVDHIVYVTFPLVKDKKILIKMLLETKKAIANCINSALQYEYLYKRISLSKDPKINFDTFIKKCSLRFGITREETILIVHLFDLVKKHEESTMEFIKNGKIIILSDDLNPEIITLEKTKEFLNLAKQILRKTMKKIRT
ncbi:MAG: hypothetical protein NTU63_02380 [Candidatus Pacearchaeota archaeon]|nr:hypothetical protein [Candidatus Pacearchaeota archaeon]